MTEQLRGGSQTYPIKYQQFRKKDRILYIYICATACISFSSGFAHTRPWRLQKMQVYTAYQCPTCSSLVLQSLPHFSEVTCRQNSSGLEAVKLHLGSATSDWISPISLAWLSYRITQLRFTPSGSQDPLRSLLHCRKTYLSQVSLNPQCRWALKMAKDNHSCALLWQRGWWAFVTWKEANLNPYQ